MAYLPPLDAAVLPAGIRSGFLDGINGLRMHVLEAGEAGRPCLLLLHGFPEIAFSWRKVMPALANAGYHVVAPDQRGYGRTTGWDGRYDGDLSSFRLLNLVHDTLALVAALGHRSTVAVIGHDFGAPVAAACALMRPDVFRSVGLMSGPFAGPPALRTGAPEAPDIHDELARLDRPRKHYQWYYSTRPADADMRGCRQGVHDFLRAYFHYKSADWPGNKPFPLKSWSAGELAKMPTYYIMDRDRDMAETVAPEMPSAAEIAACRWLPDDELRVYSAEYERTGFQGGLQWYRCRTSGSFEAELSLFAGRTIDVPAVFIAGRSDWGVYQSPGAIDRMQHTACTRMVGCHLVEGAGHWVQQEQPERVAGLLLEFLREQEGADWTVHHVNLPAHDVRQSAAFFRDVIGMREGAFERPVEGRGRFSSDPATLAVFGEQNRGLHVVRPQPGFARDNELLHNPTIGGHVAITVADLEAVRARLDAAGVLYSNAGEYAMAGYRQIYLYDPSMNLIEVNQKVE